METVKSQKKQVFFLRLTAIILTIISLVALFCPGMIDFVSKEKKDYVDYMADVYERSYGYSETDARRIARAESNAAYGDFTASSFRKIVNQIHAMSLEQRLQDKYAKKNFKNSPYAKKYSSYKEYLEGTLTDEELKERPLIVIGSIAADILLYGSILVGLIAIVMYALNKTRVFGILHTVLAFLALAFTIALLIDSNHNGEEASLGVCAVLLPVLSLAACLIYKRDKKEKPTDPAPVSTEQEQRPQNSSPDPEASEAAELRPQPQYAAPAQFQPVNNWSYNPEANQAQAQPEDRADHWFCPACGKKSPASAMFCQDCGTRRNG